ncbi:MAG: hypothetical protein AAF612_03620, partial [Planctomycetota bacterium]
APAVRDALLSAAARAGVLEDWAARLTALAGENEQALTWALAGAASERLGDSAAAEASYARAMDGAPGLAFVRTAWIDLALGRYDVDAARRRLGPWADATHADALQARVRVLWVAGEEEAALDLLAEQVDEGVSPVDLVLLKGRVLSELGHTDRALNTAEALTRRSPSSEAAHVLLFDVLRQRNDARDAPRVRRAYLFLRESLPESAVTRRITARVLIETQRYEQAEALLEALDREASPEDAERLAVLRLLLALGQSDDEGTRRWFDRVAAADRYDAQAMLLAARRFTALRDGGRLLVAEGALLEPMASTPRRASNYASNLLAQGRYAEALGRVDRALDQLSDQDVVGNQRQRAVLVRLRGLALARLDRADEGWAAYTGWRDGLSASNRLRMADELAQVGSDVAEACGRSEEAARIMLGLLNTAGPGAQADFVKNNVAYRLARSGVYLAVAERLVRESLEARPDKPEDLDTLGWVLYKQGAYAESVEKLRASMSRIDPALMNEADAEVTLAVVGDHLGDALYRLGDVAGAEQAWRDAAERTPLGTNTVSQMDTWGLDERVRAKLAAVASGQAPPVAEVIGPPGPDEPTLEALLSELAGGEAGGEEDPRPPLQPQ